MTERKGDGARPASTRTEAARTFDDVEASERRLALILNNVSDVVFTIAVEPDDNFRFSWVNHRFREVTGLSDEQIVGANVRDVIPQPALDMVLANYREAIVTRKPVRWEETSEYPAGTRIGVVTVAAADDGDGSVSQLVGVVHDITEREEAEQALRESEREYRELVQNANSIILRWTRDGRIAFLNDFGQRFFGYAADEIVGRHVMDTIVPAMDTEGRDLGRLMEEILADPGSFEQNVNENVKRNGTRVWVAWTNRIVHDEAGEVAEIMSIGTDVTEQRHAQEAIRDLNATLEQRVADRTAELAIAKDRAEAADRVKSTFLATMSHELRTPLNSIIGFTGIILQGLAGPLSDEQRRQLLMVQASSRHLLALINDVLDISKIEAGQLEVSLEPFDVRGSIDKAMQIVQPLAEKKSLRLDVNIAPEVGRIVSDPRRFEQILLNLANNAIKFTDRGGVDVGAVITGGNGQPPSLRVTVSDTGIGIKPEDLGRLFKPFQQVDSGLTRQREGTGLGLAICSRLAELLGGKVEAQSVWGEGSVFTLIVPAVKPKDS